MFRQELGIIILFVTIRFSGRYGNCRSFFFFYNSFRGVHNFSGGYSLILLREATHSQEIYSKAARVAETNQIKPRPPFAQAPVVANPKRTCHGRSYQRKCNGRSPQHVFRAQWNTWIAEGTFERQGAMGLEVNVWVRFFAIDPPFSPG